MDKEIPPLFDRLVEKYGEINRISDWQSLRAAQDLEEINRIITRRGELLADIRETENSLINAGAKDAPQYKGRYDEVNAVIREIYESDKGIMQKIEQRMNEIKDELKAKTLFRTRALPGYIKQKYAFSK
jgi:hypothetical protein